MIDTVIFDMDGTLLDTVDDLTDAVNAALGQQGHPPRNREDIRGFIGNGVQVLIQKAVPEGTSEADVEACLKAFKAYYAAHSQDKTAPYEGILPLLSALKQKRMKTAIISNKYEQVVAELAEDYFPGSFDTVRGERKDVPRKPEPDGAFSILEELGSKPERAVYIGDTEVDMQTACNAGLTAIGVTWGFRSRDVLLEAGADYMIERPEQLLEVLERLK